MARNSSPEKLISIEEAAEYLDINIKTAQEWARINIIPAYKMGKLWKFKLSELENYTKKCTNKYDKRSMLGL